MQGRKAMLSQQAQGLRATLALQEQGRKIFMLSCEEKLRQKRERLPPLREAVQQDIRALSAAQKAWKPLAASEAFGAQKPLGIALAGKTLEVAQEKLQAQIHEQVNTCNMLLYQLRQRSRVRDELQEKLQQLQDAEMDNRWHQAQVVHQLRNSIEKMLIKVQAAEKVTSVYLVVRDALRKELAQLPQHLDLLSKTADLYHGELETMELMALDALKAAIAAKKDMAKKKAEFLAERELWCRSLATQKSELERHLRAQARSQPAKGLPSVHTQDPLVAAKEATEFQAASEKLEKAKAAVECSHFRDIPSKLLAQKSSLAVMQERIKVCEQKRHMMEEKLKELEVKQAKLKFRPPAETNRRLEELRMHLQQEEARLEQLRGPVLRNQQVLVQIGDAVESLFAYLRGITVPGQDDSVKASSVEEKLQQCQQKLQYLVQRVASLSPEMRSLDQENKALVKVQNALEKAAVNHPQNVRIPLKESSSTVEDPSDFPKKGKKVVPTRKDIKKQGLQLIKANKVTRIGWYQGSFVDLRPTADASDAPDRLL
ncbi:coiled-coil domain-containing protein 183-like isoform 1-T1 [Leptosomus discolor]